MPTPREQLADALKKARLDAGLQSHGALAKKINVSRPVVSKAENPAYPLPSDETLTDWAEKTGASAEEFLDLAQRCKSASPDWFMPYLAAEQAATIIRCWGPLIVPGLLQTEPYAQAVLAVEPFTPERLGELVTERMARQKVLERVYLTAVIDASVLSRCIGSPAVMAEQCAHLAAMAERPNIALHVIPAGMNTGAWGGISVASRGGLVTVSFGTASDDVTTTAAGQVDRAMQGFERILGYAMPPVASVEFTRQQEEQWKDRI